MEEKLKEIGTKTTGIKKILSTWAKSLGTKHILSQQYNETLRKPWGYSLASAIVLHNIKKALGLDQCYCYFTSAAPISVSTLNYFASLDMASKWN